MSLLNASSCRGNAVAPQVTYGSISQPSLLPHPHPPTQPAGGDSISSRNENEGTPRPFRHPTPYPLPPPAIEEENTDSSTEPTPRDSPITMMRAYRAAHPIPDLEENRESSPEPFREVMLSEEEGEGILEIRRGIEGIEVVLRYVFPLYFTADHFPLHAILCE